MTPHRDEQKTDFVRKDRGWRNKHTPQRADHNGVSLIRQELHFVGLKAGQDPVGRVMTLDGRERFRRAAEGFETRHRLAVRKTQQAAAHQRKQKKSQEHAIQDACLPGPGLRKCAHTITALCSNRADQPSYGHIPQYIIPYHSCVKKATRKPREFVKSARIAGKPYFLYWGKGTRGQIGRAREHAGHCAGFVSGIPCHVPDAA
jgi:hypothetical protein